jgi:hypothetical protein
LLNAITRNRSETWGKRLYLPLHTENKVLTRHLLPFLSRNQHLDFFGPVDADQKLAILPPVLYKESPLWFPLEEVYYPRGAFHQGVGGHIRAIMDAR